MAPQKGAGKSPRKRRSRTPAVRMWNGESRCPAGADRVSGLTPVAGSQWLRAARGGGWRETMARET